MRKTDAAARREKAIRALELKREIEDLIAAEQHELAIILTQTLLEVRLEADLHAYAQESEEPQVVSAAIDLLPSFNLSHGRVRRFVETLMRDRIQQHDELEHWARLRGFQDLRNSLVHEGNRQVARDEADGFLDAVLEITRIVRTSLLLAIHAYDEDDAHDDERWVTRRSTHANPASD